MRILAVSVAAIRAFGSPLLCAWIATQSSSVEAAERLWQASDSIAVRYYGRYPMVPQLSAHEPVASMSPDGRYFAVLSSAGDMSCDCIIRHLEIFDVRDVSQWILRERDSSRGAPAAVRDVKMRALTGASDAIRDVKWQGAGSTIAFLGNDGVSDQVYRIRLPDGVLEQLTNDRSTKRDALVEDHVVLYTRDVEAHEPIASTYPSMSFPRGADGHARYRTETTTRSEYVAQFRNDGPWVLPINEHALIKSWISSSGDKAIVLSLDFALQAGRYFFVDFLSKKIYAISETKLVPNFDGAVAASPRNAFWSSDDSSVLILHPGVPFQSAETGSQKDAKDMGSERLLAAAYSTKGRTWQVFDDTAREDATAAWSIVGSKVLVRAGEGFGSTGAKAYSFADGRWTVNESIANSRQPHVEVLASGLQVRLSQSANDPPMLVAAIGKRSKVLSTPDPALRGLRRAKVDRFSWKASDGSVAVGGLSIPPVDPGRAKPVLVVQIGSGGNDLDAFLPDGPVFAEYAHQALVGRGMAVLSMNFLDLPSIGTPVEAESFIDRVDQAVAVLAERGLVDPVSVGLVGFSRGGYLVHYAVTHPGKTRVGAAIVADAATFDLVEYLLPFIDGNGESPDYLDPLVGSNPWKSLQGWREHDVLLNTHRIKAPVLFTNHRVAASTIDGLEHDPIVLTTMAAMEANGRTYEYIFFPDAGHAIRRPRQRLAAMSANVDWMSFWLRGYEDGAPEKAEQYRRWRDMKSRMH